MIARLAVDALSAYDGAALLWYARNRIFFDQGRERATRVWLVCYEDILRAPENELSRLFTFAGWPFSPAFAADVSRQNRAKPSVMSLAPAIEAACEELLRAFDAQVARQEPVPPPCTMRGHAGISLASPTTGARKGS